MCLWLCEMKYSSHKKWLSSLSSTTHYNDSPVQAETRGIVTQQHTHIWSPRGSLWVGVPSSLLATTSHAGLLTFFSTLWSSRWGQSFQAAKSPKIGQELVKMTESVCYLQTGVEGGRFFLFLRAETIITENNCPFDLQMVWLSQLSLLWGQIKAARDIPMAFSTGFGIWGLYHGHCFWDWWCATITDLRMRDE